jgi:hypothetical protein
MLLLSLRLDYNAKPKPPTTAHGNGDTACICWPSIAPSTSRTGLFISLQPNYCNFTFTFFKRTINTSCIVKVSNLHNVAVVFDDSTHPNTFPWVSGNASTCTSLSDAKSETLNRSKTITKQSSIYSAVAGHLNKVTQARLREPTITAAMVNDGTPGAARRQVPPPAAGRLSTQFSGARPRDYSVDRCSFRARSVFSGTEIRSIIFFRSGEGLAPLDRLF